MKVAEEEKRRCGWANGVRRIEKKVLKVSEMTRESTLFLPINVIIL